MTLKNFFSKAVHTRILRQSERDHESAEARTAVMSHRRSHTAAHENGGPERTESPSGKAENNSGLFTGTAGKRYYADTPTAALQLAEKELGPDAVLLSTTRTPESHHHLGRYMLTFALWQAAEGDETFLSRSETAPQSPSPVVLASPSGAHRFSNVLHEFLAASPQPSQRRNSSEAPESSSRVDTYRLAALRHLEQGEIPGILAAGVIREAVRELADLKFRPNEAPTSRWKAALREVLLRRIRIDSRTPSTPGKRAILLVGPPGAGKTSSAVKLAIRISRADPNRSIRLITLQTSGTALTTGMEAVAKVLGVPLTVIGSLGVLEKEVTKSSPGTLLIIDTQGISGRALAELQPLSQFLAARRDFEAHLVLPVTLRPEDCTRFVDLFEMLQPSKLLFTMLDLTSARGGIVREAIRTGKALSFFSYGRSAVYDLIPADAEGPVDTVLAGFEGTASGSNETTSLQN